MKCSQALHKRRLSLPRVAADFIWYVFKQIDSTCKFIILRTPKLYGMVVDGTYAKMWIADGIFYFIYKPIPILDLPKAKTIVQERFVVQNQVNYPIFCDLRGVQQSVKEARD